MTDSTPDPLALELAAIFRAEAEERIARLREQLADLRAGRGDVQALLADARREAHTLKGTAGTVGADAFGEAARRLEKELDRLRADAARPLSLDAADALLEALARA